MWDKKRLYKFLSHYNEMSAGLLKYEETKLKGYITIRKWFYSNYGYYNFTFHIYSCCLI